MTRSHFVKKARHDIYWHGIVTEKTHEKGKNAGKTYIYYDKSKPNPEGDKLLVAKGESYYWWKFPFSSKTISKTAPKRAQLTKSSFYSTLWTIEDEWALDESDIQASVDDLIAYLEDLKSECESSLENMPESLQESSDSGMMLQERIDGLESWIDEIGSIDISIDKELLLQQAKSEHTTSGDDIEAPIDDDEIEKAYQELFKEKIKEIYDDITSCNPGF